MSPFAEGIQLGFSFQLGVPGDVAIPGVPWLSWSHCRPIESAFPALVVVKLLAFIVGNMTQTKAYLGSCSMRRAYTIVLE